MAKSEKFKIISFSFILVILFLAACTKENPEEEITGSAVEDSENCRFGNPEDCSPIEITRVEPEEEADEESTNVTEPEEKITLGNMTKLSLTCKPGWE